MADLCCCGQSFSQIPFFSSFLGVVSALLISGFSFYLPALMWFILLKEGHWYSRKNIFSSIANGAIFLGGLVLLVAVSVSMPLFPNFPAKISVPALSVRECTRRSTRSAKSTSRARSLRPTRARVADEPPIVIAFLPTLPPYPLFII